MRWQEPVFWVCLWTTRFLPCLSLWKDTKIGYDANHNVVLVDFVPADVNFTRYRLDLCFLSTSGNLTKEQRRCNGLIPGRVRSLDVTTESAVVRQEIENVGTAGYFLVRVTPLMVDEGGSCRSDCRSINSEIFFLQGNDNPDAYNCTKWVVVMSLDLQSSQRRAKVAYYVPKNTSKCVFYFVVELWYNLSRFCNGIDGYRLASSYTYGATNEVVFTNLEPGNYCVRLKPVEPFNPACHGECQPRHSRIKTLDPILSDVVPEVALPAVQTSEQSNAIWMYPTILGSLLLVSITLGFAIRWRRINSRIKTRVGNQVEIQVHVDVKDQNLKSNCDSAEEVVVLYSHDSKLHEEGARLLVDFLLKCCGLKVCTALSDLHQIAVSPELWVVEKLSTGKVVVIESEGAVARQHSSLNRQCSSDGLLDKVFDNSLSFLCSKDSLTDYGRLFVVHFTKPSNGILDSLTPRLRFALPEHLPELYAGLVESGCGSDFGKELLSKWEVQPSYVRLRDFCSVA